MKRKLKCLAIGILFPVCLGVALGVIAVVGTLIGRLYQWIGLVGSFDDGMAYGVYTVLVIMLVLAGAFIACEEFVD